MNNAESKTLPQEFYKAIMDSIFDAVYTVDNTGVITYWNQSCTRITGYGADEMVGYNYLDTTFSCVKENPDGSPSEKSGIRIVLDTGMPGTSKGYITRKTGQRIPIESHISAIRDADDHVIGAVEVFRDISPQLALEQSHRQVLKMSRNDQLTGLYNRGAVSELLKAEIERSRRYKQPLSIIMIDLDHFKLVNDQYGHDCGDKVLEMVGSLLLHNLRKPDTPGRWGGEEFLVLAPGSDGNAGQQLAERIRCYIKQISIPKVDQNISASLGVCQLGEEQSRDQLLYGADQALYQAKDGGRDRVVLAGCDK